MTYLLPGRIVHRFTTKKHHDVIIRYPRWEDLDQMIPYINTLSREDTYLTFSGETVTKEGEMYYLAETLKAVERGDTVYLGCFLGDTLIGSSTISRDLQARKRSFHIGIFGITVAKNYRNEGVGEVLAQVTMMEARRIITGLKLLVLNVYSPNTVAQYVYRKLGFKEAGRIPQAVLYKGKYVDDIKMYLPLEEHF